MPALKTHGSWKLRYHLTTNNAALIIHSVEQERALGLCWRKKWTNICDPLKFCNEVTENVDWERKVSQASWVAS